MAMASARARVFSKYHPAHALLDRIHIHMSLVLDHILFGLARFDHFDEKLEPKWYSRLFLLHLPLRWSSASIQILVLKAPGTRAKSIRHHHKCFWSRPRRSEVHLPGALSKTHFLWPVSCSPPPIRPARPCFFRALTGAQRPIEKPL